MVLETDDVAVDLLGGIGGVVTLGGVCQVRIDW